MVRFSPRKQMHQLEDLFTPLIDKNNIKLYFFISGTIPNFLYHDLKRVSQILVNLLTNAIKYTKKGAILVKVDWMTSKLTTSNELGVVKYTVSDSG